jgi:4-hydroxy-tetrahydrodipicolinate reductase
MRVGLVGLGPIGLEAGRALAGRVELVGAADPAHAGTTLPWGTKVVATAAELYQTSRPEAVLLCTGSTLPAIAASLEEAIEAGVHVVSSCEEMSEPWLRHPALAAILDERARSRGVVLLGVGVNPGLVMDRLVWTTLSACATVTRVAISRVVDAAKRRGPLRAKVGEGLSPEEFVRGVAAGKLGHVGLGESAAVVAKFLGDEVVLGDLKETIEPVVDGGTGKVLGVRQSAEIGRVRLDLQMSVGAPSPRDRIVVAGDPPVDLEIAGGLHGDRATVGTLVNGVRLVAAMAPGLRGALDHAPGFRL